MLRRHAPTLLLGTWKVGTEADDGGGIEMAQAVGARVKNMHAGRSVTADHPAAAADRRDHRRRQRPALHQRGHLHGPRRPGRSLRTRGHMLPGDRRGRLRAQLDGPRGLLGVRIGRGTGGRDGPAGGLARGDPGALQPPCPAGQRTRSSTSGPNGSDRWFHRSEPSTCAGTPRPMPPSHSAVSRPPWPARSWISRVCPSRGCLPPGGRRPGSAPSDTPRVSHWATRLFSAVSPVRQRPGRRPLSECLAAGRGHQTAPRLSRDSM